MKRIIKKQTVLYIVFLTLLVTFFSCSKNDNPAQPDPDPSAPKLFQHKWIFESLVVYPTIAMDPNGPTYPVLSGDGKRFFDFRTNGKFYFMIANSTTDSANYRMQSDSVITMNEYRSGVLSTQTDTIVIRTVTENSLFFYNRNVGGDYLKYTAKR